MSTGLTDRHKHTPGKKRLTLRISVGIALAIILLGLIIRSISFEEVLLILQTANLALLSLAALLNIFMLMLMAYRWYILSFPDQHRLPYLSLLNASFIAILFNNFLPSTIGGDTYRSYYVSKENESVGVIGALSIVFVDRIMGLIGLMIVSLISVLLYEADLLQEIRDISVWIVIIGLAFTSILWLSLNRSTYRFCNWILRHTPIPKKVWFQTRLDMFETHLTGYTAHKKLLFYGLLLSIMLRSVWLLSCYVLGQAFHFDLPILTYFALIPIIEAIRMIPITIQGLGVREGLFVLFFTQVGLNVSEATVLGVMVYLLLNINGFIGFILYLQNLAKRRNKYNT